MASIIGKNLVLLIVLGGLVQLIRRMALKSGDSVVGFTVLTEFEERVSDVEGLMKKTAKMIQVQVDVMDKKMKDEVGGLRKELNERIDEKGTILESGLRRLETRSDELERLVSDLKDENWLSKGEFNNFVEELRSVKGYEGDGLDEIREFARGVVLKEIEKHAADGLGRVDYALASGGGAVVKHSEVYDFGRGNWFLKAARNGVHPSAEKMLKPSFGEPGQCFPLKDTRGFVQIRLRTAIIPEAVTLEHVAKSVAYDRSSAPKDCRVSGWLQGRTADSVINNERMYLLTEFTYDLEKSNAQTFNVLDSAASGVIDTVRLDFTSNHGSPSHTCIYRLRVHGHEPASVSMMAVDS